MQVLGALGTFRFGDFELDGGAYALRRWGRPVRIERQPMDLLLLLVERRGQLVLRSEIVDLLWGKDVFVDVETGVHTAIRKVRRALGDSAEAPSFVETVPGKGYRFIATVEVVGGSRDSAGPSTTQPPAVPHVPDSVPSEALPVEASTIAFGEPAVGRVVRRSGRRLKLPPLAPWSCPWSPRRQFPQHLPHDGDSRWASWRRSCSSAE